MMMNCVLLFSGFIGNIAQEWRQNLLTWDFICLFKQMLTPDLVCLFKFPKASDIFLTDLPQAKCLIFDLWTTEQLELEAAQSERPYLESVPVMTASW